MRKDEQTWEMKKEKFVSNLLHISSLEFGEINGDEQIEFMEGEISIQFNFPYFQIDSFEISNNNKPQTTMNNFKLPFGKYKGQDFFSTPKSYQNWLLNQDWFKAPNQAPVVTKVEKAANQVPVVSEVQQAAKQISELSTQLNGWDGHSSRGAAIYDSIFDAEVMMDAAVASERKYFGMNEETKQAEMDWECAEINAENEIYNHYND